MRFFQGAKFKFGARIVSPFSAWQKRLHYKDVTSLVAQKTRSISRSIMAEMKKRHPRKNSAAGEPGTVNCANKTGTPGITMHYFPNDKTLWQKWTLFV